MSPLIDAVSLACWKFGKLSYIRFMSTSNDIIHFNEVVKDSGHGPQRDTGADDIVVPYVVQDLIAEALLHPLPIPSTLANADSRNASEYMESLELTSLDGFKGVPLKIGVSHIDHEHVAVQLPHILVQEVVVEQMVPRSGRVEAAHALRQLLDGVLDDVDIVVNSDLAVSVINGLVHENDDGGSWRYYSQRLAEHSKILGVKILSYPNHYIAFDITNDITIDITIDITVDITISISMGTRTSIRITTTDSETSIDVRLMQWVRQMSVLSYVILSSFNHTLERLLDVSINASSTSRSSSTACIVDACEYIENHQEYQAIHQVIASSSLRG